MTAAEHSTETYYGTDIETYYVSSDDRIWLLQTPNERDGFCYEVVDKIPTSVHVLPDVVCRDFEEVREEIETIEVVSEEMIERLRAEASYAGDFITIGLCDRALDGDYAARAECARSIRAAKAMEG